MEKKEVRLNGGSEQVEDSREPQPVQHPAPGKVTRSSKRPRTGNRRFSAR